MNDQKLQDETATTGAASGLSALLGPPMPSLNPRTASGVQRRLWPVAAALVKSFLEFCYLLIEIGYCEAKALYLRILNGYLRAKVRRLTLCRDNLLLREREPLSEHRADRERPEDAADNFRHVHVDALVGCEPNDQATRPAGSGGAQS